eukprot:gene9462-1701_t
MPAKTKREVRREDTDWHELHAGIVPLVRDFLASQTKTSQEEVYTQAHSMDPCPQHAVPSSEGMPAQGLHEGSNPSARDLVIAWNSHRYVLPPQSRFLMSDLSYLASGSLTPPAGGFTAAVVDPPWPNKSAQRSKSYRSMPVERLLSIPMRDLLGLPRGNAHLQYSRQTNDAMPSPGTEACAIRLVVLWVTHKPAFLEFAKDQLLPAWGLKLWRRVHWLKLSADDFAPVCAIDSAHRKPYETLWLAVPNAMLPDIVQDTSRDTVFASVPTQHSQKPPLGSLLPSWLNEVQQLHAALMSSQSSLTSQPAAYQATALPTDSPAPAKRSRTGLGQLEAGPTCSLLAPVVQDTPANQPRPMSIQTACHHEVSPSAGRLSCTTDAPSDVPPVVVTSAGMPGHLRERDGSSEDNQAYLFPSALQHKLPHPRVQVVELFARNLTPGWVSWGNEVLKFQHEGFFHPLLSGETAPGSLEREPPNDPHSHLDAPKST